MSRPESGAPRGGRQAKQSRRTRILIAEDDDSLRRLIRLSVDVGELDIDEAGDGETAILLAHENPPDVALLDWSMPGPTGLDVCREWGSRASRARARGSGSRFRRPLRENSAPQV